MSQSFPQTFIKQFAVEVHMLFQQMGSILASTVDLSPSSPNLVGDSDRVQRLGLGQLTTKGRHAVIPSMDVAHDFVDIFVTDRYGLEWIDKLDERKSNVNWRLKLARMLVAAAGRDVDDNIIQTLDSTTSTPVPIGGTGLDFAKILAAKEALDSNEVPMDGRFLAIGARQAIDALQIPEFASSDFIATKPLPSGDAQKTFLGFTFVQTNRLPVTGDDRTCFAYWRGAINRAVGQEIETDIFWDGERKAHGITVCVSDGSELIEDNGVVEVHCDET